MKSVDKQLYDKICRVRVKLFNRVSKETCNEVYFHIHNQSYKQLDVQMNEQFKQNISI